MIFLQLLIRRECASLRGRGRTLRTVMVTVLALLCVALSPSSAAAGAAASVLGPFLHARHAAVASDSRAASAAGVEILRAGGNAVDAACATTLALGVVNPFASGLGGGGFALVYLAKTGKVTALDFRETAPSALTRHLKDGVGLTPQGGLSVGVPGEARGLADLVRRFGALPFRVAWSLLSACREVFPSRRGWRSRYATRLNAIPTRAPRSSPRYFPSSERSRRDYGRAIASRDRSLPRHL